ncbi:MAG TPA: serine/threonine protein kinase [Caldithrix sp.]|nr:serine/threonine protein kinase [Caldithrix sp.]
MKVFWPDKLAHFQQRELLGASQYGLVYRVFNPKRKQITVVKLIEAVQVAQQRVVKRFKREIKSLQKINSPHVVKLLDYWIEPNFIAFEMEYVPGISLEIFVRQSASISYPKKEGIILEIVRQICLGLEVLHLANLVHRDIKPSNLLLNSPSIHAKSTAEEIARTFQNHDFLVKISDLGVVKDLTASVSITRTSDFIGTASYVSPEQAEGKKITPASDLYSLGVIWYELLAGANPFQHGTIIKTINAHLHEEAPAIRETNPQVPIDLEHILMLLLQKDPEQRFFSAKRLERILRQRQSKTGENEFDVSLLVDQPQPAQKNCQEFQKLFSEIFSEPQNGNIYVPLYEQAVHRDHFFHHLQHGDISQDFHLLTFRFDRDTGFTYSFSKQVFLQTSAEEKEDILKNLLPDSLLHKLSTFYRLENFYEQCDYARKNFRRVPAPILLYNHIQFIVTILRTLCRRKKLLFLFPGLPESLSAHASFIIPILVQLKGEPLHWIFPMTNPELAEMRELLRKNNLVPRDFRLEAFFPSAANCPDAEDLLSRRETETRLKGKKNFANGLNRHEQKFLKLFALAGANNTVAYVNWLLTKFFNKNSDIIISLLQKRILEQVTQIDSGKIFAFTTPEAYQFFQKNKEAHQTENDLSAISTFWETQEKLPDREKLAGFYFQLKEYSRALQLTRELLDFYFATTDFQRREYYLDRVKELKQTQKIPHRTFIRFEIEDLVNKAHRGAAADVFFRARELYTSLSTKYPREKEQLLSLIYLQAALLGKTNWLKNELKISAREAHHEKTILDFSEALLLLLSNKLNEAAENISFTLMKLNETDQYWQIPTGSFLLAEIFSKQQKWEQSYKYAAIAFQTARVINDFWVMRHCLGKIPDNPYYQTNKSNLLNWERLKQNLFQVEPELLYEPDWREKILKIIR